LSSSNITTNFVCSASLGWSEVLEHWISRLLGTIDPVTHADHTTSLSGLDTLGLRQVLGDEFQNLILGEGAVTERGKDRGLLPDGELGVLLVLEVQGKDGILFGLVGVEDPGRVLHEAVRPTTVIRRDWWSEMDNEPMITDDSQPVVRAGLLGDHLADTSRSDVVGPIREVPHETLFQTRHDLTEDSLLLLAPELGRPQQVLVGSQLALADAELVISIAEILQVSLLSLFVLLLFLFRLSNRPTACQEDTNFPLELGGVLLDHLVTAEARVRTTVLADQRIRPVLPLSITRLVRTLDRLFEEVVDHAVRDLFLFPLSLATQDGHAGRNEHETHKQILHLNLPLPLH